jgi:hypothetical protein
VLDALGGSVQDLEDRDAIVPAIDHDVHHRARGHAVDFAPDRGRIGQGHCVGVAVFHGTKEVCLGSFVAKLKYHKAPMSDDACGLFFEWAIGNERRVNLIDARAKTRYLTERQSHIGVLRDVAHSLGRVNRCLGCRKFDCLQVLELGR